MYIYVLGVPGAWSESGVESPGTGVLLSLRELETKQVLLTTGPSLQFLFKILMANEVPVFHVFLSPSYTFLVYQNISTPPGSYVS